MPDASSGTVPILLNLPVIGIFPNALNFGTEKVGVKSNPQTITIGNPSGTPITVKKPTISGADASDFAQTTTCPLSPATLAPGSSCSVVVTFTPKTTGFELRRSRLPIVFPEARSLSAYKALVNEFQMGVAAN